MDDLKVLLVEDQPEARSMMVSMFAELGISQVFEAPNGREALSFMDAAPDFVNFIVCDWNMPEMTGVDFLGQVRSADPYIPFLMVTGRGDMRSVMQAKTFGVSGYIRKPFSLDELEAKLKIIRSKMLH